MLLEEEIADISRQRAGEKNGEELYGYDCGIRSVPSYVSVAVFLPEEGGGVGAVFGAIGAVFVAQPAGLNVGGERSGVWVVCGYWVGVDGSVREDAVVKE